MRVVLDTDTPTPRPVSRPGGREVPRMRRRRASPVSGDGRSGLASAGLLSANIHPYCWGIPSVNPKFLNRQDAKNAKIHRAQNANSFTHATAPCGALGHSALISRPGGLGGPRWRLGGETVSSDEGEKRFDRDGNHRQTGDGLPLLGRDPHWTHETRKPPGSGGFRYGRADGTRTRDLRRDRTRTYLGLSEDPRKLSTFTGFRFSSSSANWFLRAA
jgi:hypothetical protein